MPYDFNDRPNPFAHSAAAGTPGAAGRAVASVGSAMREIYWWMTAGLAITGIVAMSVARSKAALQLIFGTPLFLVLIVAEFALVFGIGWGIKKISAGTATALFMLYSAVTGATLASVFLRYTATDIGTAFFITGGTFGAMAVWGTVTKRDLTGLGHFAMMGLFGLIIAMIVNFFLHSAMLYWLVSFAGVLVFTLLTAYDVQRLRALAASGAIPEKKLAIFGALNLYLDFINLFIFLLSILGGRRR